jgi:hypothetical protein
VQDALLYVVLGVVAVSAAVAVVALAGAGKAYDEIGKGGLSLRDGSERPAGDAVSGGVAVRDEEVRQMLEARSARRVARGQAPLDVDAELRRVTASTAAVDPQLRDEVRQLVVARNARHVRHGRDPLDVEAEVERELRDLGAT